jgi:hypothetical protein
MKRKIEKYLSKKQGVDVANIKYTEDGRFDFMGDLDGVLNAVRGKDGPSRSRTKSDKKLVKPKKKRDPLSSNSQQHHMTSVGMHHPPPHMYGYPYMHAPPPPMHHLPVMEMRHHTKALHQDIGEKKKLLPRATYTDIEDKENKPIKQKHDPFSPQRDRHPFSGSSPTFQGDMTPSSNIKTPFAINSGDFPSEYFDRTPKKEDGSNIQVNGMTPLTDLRESLTPFHNDGIFSPPPEVLSKALFKEESILKTPKPHEFKPMRIRIGSIGNDIDVAETMCARFRSYVSISPICATRSSLETDELSQPLSLFMSGKSCSKRKSYVTDNNSTPKCNLFLDPMKSIQTPRNSTMDTVDSEMSYPEITGSPYDTILQTPNTQNGSFWTDQLGMTESDFTPFRSPPSDSSSKKRRKMDTDE